MQRPSGEQPVNSGSDQVVELRAQLKQLNAQKKAIIEKIQEIDGQMRGLAGEVTKKV